jgi:5-(aminomethyl)-3-furanmethanol phosphate kinase
MLPLSAGLPEMTPVIVKLGGSLYNHVPDLIQVFHSSRRCLFIVPGGGPFADAVRKTRVNDDAAHWMAISAMDQYGWFIASHGMNVTSLLQRPTEPVVFLPYCSIRKHDPLPHSWDVTSDSLAAWIANKLGLDLLLLKSVDGIVEGDNLLELVATPIKTEVVDPFFLPFVLEKKTNVMIMNGSHVKRVEKFLQGDLVPGTRIGTTF